MSVRQFVVLSACQWRVSVCHTSLSVCLSVCMPVCLSMACARLSYLVVFLSVRLPSCLAVNSMCPSVSLVNYVCVSVIPSCPFVRPSICVSGCQLACACHTSLSVSSCALSIACVCLSLPICLALFLPARLSVNGVCLSAITPSVFFIRLPGCLH